jgi:hypothetical protein
MSTHKRVSDKYTISSPDVVIKGNLVVVGTTTNVSATNTEIKDNIIVLNKGETGNGVTLGSAGITVDRGPSIANVSLVYRHSSNTWSLSNDGVTYNEIATIGGGGFLTQVADDTSPELGGNLDVVGYSISSSTTGNVTIDGTMRLLSMSGSVSNIQPTDSTLLYANAVGFGGSGIYVNNSNATEKELITKDTAFFWSLVL